MELALVAVIVVVVLVAVPMVARQRTGSHDTGRLERVDRKLDLLATHLGVAVSAPLPNDVQAALDTGNKIEAIKRYRAATGAGLKEAKDAVEGNVGPHAVERKIDALLAHVGAADPDQPSAAVREAVRAGRTIEAIRAYRAATGAGLQESKAAIDRIAHEPDDR